jgi:UDP-GlcNAc:undecaprenyl-phosphate GlcNAc-1-phosphate transferase
MNFFFPLFAFLLVLVIVPFARRMALRVGYVDKPGGRKNHDNPTPPIGGLIIVPVFIFLSVLSGADIQTQWPFWTGLCVIMFSGALDDRYAIKPRWKFLAQFAAAGLIVCAGTANVAYLGNLLGFGDIWLGFMHYPFSLIAAVLLINAINLMDGLDGLAAGSVFIALMWLLVTGLISHNNAIDLSVAIMMATIAGFLVYNMRNPLRRRASIFLGDAGSMSLGLTLAWFGMTLGHTEKVPPISVAWIFALPIMDTCAQFARRVREGRHPFDADRNHFHHHFINVNISVRAATATIILIGFFLGLIGVLGMILNVPQPILGYLWIAAILIHMKVSLQPERYRRIVSAFTAKASL